MNILNIGKAALMALFLSLILACSTPLTKEQYLQQYAEFIDNIKQHHNEFSDQQWAEQDQNFDKFSQKLKHKFAEKLTWREQLRVGSYELQYSIYRSKKALLGGVKDAIDEVGNIGKQVQQYIDQDMREDLTTIIEEAGSVGQELQQLLEQSASEFNNQINKLKPAPAPQNPPNAPQNDHAI